MKNPWFVGAAVVAVSIGLLHSFLGERLVLRPLERLDGLPQLLGSRRFMVRVLRFAWHITTVLLVGMAAIGIVIASDGVSRTAGSTAKVVAVTYLVCAAVAIVGSRGRHFSWVLFLAAGLAMWVGAIR
ncbi:MAG: hypothetical protein R3344_04880 [Acidobacteriota bacterium]|nr:hypothetical protein [Acidobacteriota bacterium]